MNHYSKNRIRRIMKNEYIFIKKLVQHNLTQLFSVMSEKIFSREFVWYVDQERYKEPAKRIIDRGVILGKSLEEFSKWPDEQFENFLALINNDLLPRCGLGPEWCNAFLTTAVTGVPIVPDQSFLTKASGKKGRQTVVITLSPETSIDEIREAWPEIKKQQKELWPNFEKVNFNKKSYLRLHDNLQYQIGKKNRRNLSMGEKFPNLSDYDFMVLAQYGIKKVKQFRSAREVNTKIIIKNKKKNADIIRDLLGIKNRKALKRKAESFKKAEQRMSKKEGQLSG